MAATLMGRDVLGHRICAGITSNNAVLGRRVKAILADVYGDPDVLVSGDLPTPKVAPDMC